MESQKLIKTLILSENYLSPSAQHNNINGETEFPPTRGNRASLVGVTDIN
jgi:hypothetical protein